jgi:hypothetical protein
MDEIDDMDLSPEGYLFRYKEVIINEVRTLNNAFLTSAVQALITQALNVPLTPFHIQECCHLLLKLGLGSTKFTCCNRAPNHVETLYAICITE